MTILYRSYTLLLGTKYSEQSLESEVAVFWASLTVLSWSPARASSVPSFFSEVWNWCPRYKNKALKMRSVLSSAAAALEKCKTKEMEEFGIENTFDLGLGVPCLGWWYRDERVFKVTFFNSHLLGTLSKPQLQSSQKRSWKIILTHFQHLLVYLCSNWKSNLRRAGHNLIASIS